MRLARWWIARRDRRGLGTDVVAVNRAEGPWDERLYAGFLDMGLDESDADEAVRVVERLWGGAAELENWRRACDEVGVPHNPAALIRHHRNNAAAAAQMDALAAQEGERGGAEVVLMTEPHDGHESAARCPGCPHEETR